MEVLNPESSGINLFDDDWKIYSRSSGKAAQYIAEGAVIDNAMLTNGCRVFGTVRHSILFAGVEVEEGAIVEDAVVMGNVKISKGAKVTHCIIGEGATIGENAVVGEKPSSGNEKNVATVGPGVRVGNKAVISGTAMVKEDVEEGGKC